MAYLLLVQHMIGIILGFPCCEEIWKSKCPVWKYGNMLCGQQQHSSRLENPKLDFLAWYGGMVWHGMAILPQQQPAAPHD